MNDMGGDVWKGKAVNAIRGNSTSVSLLFSCMFGTITNHSAHVASIFGYTESHSPPWFVFCVQ